MVDFSGIIEYFKNLKIRHASQGILGDEDIKYLFPDIKEITLTGKKRLRKYYPSTTRQRRLRKINFGLGDLSMMNKLGKKRRRNNINNLKEGEEESESVRI